jgi:hypothetical protein
MNSYGSMDRTASAQRLGDGARGCQTTSYRKPRSGDHLRWKSSVRSQTQGVTVGVSVSPVQISFPNCPPMAIWGLGLYKGASHASNQNIQVASKYWTIAYSTIYFSNFYHSLYIWYHDMWTSFMNFWLCVLYNFKTTWWQVHGHV